MGVYRSCCVPNYTNSRTLLKATLSWQNRSLHLSNLVDSGADKCFLDREVARQLGVDIIPLDVSLEVSALNGMHLARIEHKTAPLSLLLSGNHQEQISFHLIDSPQTPLVLGHPWLRLHNPSLEWTSGKVAAWSTHCLLNCLRSASAPATVAPQPVPDPPDLTLVP